jgi:CcmD family protein
MSPFIVSAESPIVDFLGSTGKIYSVVAVICAIFIGIAIFLIRLDRKLTKLENQIDNEKRI